MHIGTFVFAQIAQFLPQRQFRRILVRYNDRTQGWALVLVKGERCSPQTIVTRCTLYKQYTTEDALETAADSYGGLTDRCMP